MKINVKKSKGITIIGLVITIIVLLILAGVTITSLNGENGIITKATEAKEMSKKEEIIENAKIDILKKQKYKRNSNITEEEFKQILTKYGTLSTGAANINEETLTTKENYDIPVKDIYEIKIIPSISTTESYVGKYADIDDNGSIDGIIFADVAKGNTVPGNWVNEDGAYTIVKQTGLKEYYVKKTEIDNRWDENNAKEVIAPKKGTSGMDRFYVMALEDIKEKTYSWYKNAFSRMSDWKGRTSREFSTGKSNTNAMIELGQNGGKDEFYPKLDYGTLIVEDLWKQESVKSTTTNKWFVPSKAEWAAFANELNIGKNTEPNSYTNHKLKGFYWSSSQSDTNNAWYAYFDTGCGDMSVNNYLFVRLAATF